MAETPKKSDVKQTGMKPPPKGAKAARPAQEKSAANLAAKKAAAKKAAAAIPIKPAGQAMTRGSPTARAEAKTAKAAQPGAYKAPALNPYDVVLHPMVTEKTMFNMDKNNALEFLVAPRATKPEIKSAVETLFTVKVHKVTTRITREGKRAVVRFAEGYSAEDIGTRIGVF